MRFAFKTSPQSTTWDDMLAVWKAADEIELFESGWTFDHFEPIFSDRSGPCLEGWLTLTALAQATSRLRVGVLVTGVPYRHPAVLANMAATLDQISHGRLELGLGAGWNTDEAERLRDRPARHQGAHGPLRRGLRRHRRPAHPGALDLRRHPLRPRRGVLRAEGRPAAPPADLHRRQRREAHPAHGRPRRPALELRRRPGGGVRAAEGRDRRALRLVRPRPRRDHDVGPPALRPRRPEGARRPRRRRSPRPASTSASSTSRRPHTPADLETIADVVAGI